jgi:hypothetical protein
MGWIVQQQAAEAAQAEAAAQARIHEFLACCCHPASSTVRGGGAVAHYATLVFERRNELAIKLATSSGTAVVNKDNARGFYDEESARAAAKMEEHRSAIALITQKRREWLASLNIERGVVVKRDTGGLRREKVTVDVVTLGHVRKELAPPELDDYLQREAERRFVAPTAPEKVGDFESWWLGHRPEKVKSWGASWIEAGETRDLGLNIQSWTIGGLPIAEALTELARAAEDGWELVHVSESQGIFQGTHSQTAASPECVRYLLRRTS